MPCSHRKPYNTERLVNKTNISRALTFVPVVGMILLFLAACNSSKEDDLYYSPSSMVAVTSFKLQSDNSVMRNLDSVFFSIDLDNGVIFNADSLPKGTRITKLVPIITYPSSVSDAVIEMQGGTWRTGTVNYKKNPSDTIDFSGDVTLTLKAEDGTSSRTYRLKVNVHESEPDSLVWGNTAVSDLPSRMASPRSQKSVMSKSGVATLIEENDGSYTLALSYDIFSAEWVKTVVTLPAGSDIRSFVSDGENFYILDDKGDLHKSSDCVTWQAVASGWSLLIGACQESILGVTVTAQGRYFCSLSKDGVTKTGTSAEEFPIDGFSNMTSTTTPWSPLATAFVAGGVKSDGTLSDEVWAYDGNNWIQLSKGCFPAIEGASLVAYRYFKKTSTMWVQTEFPVWMIIGGKTADNSFNRDIYISYDNCVSWRKANEQMQMPEFIPETVNSDYVVLDTPKSANLSDAWTKMKSRRRISYEIDGFDISWQCPYIYKIGGFDTSGKLQNQIWRGVIARLTFVPLI